MAGEIDLDQLVTASGGFSPADTEYAARRASQNALEKSLDVPPDAGRPVGPCTDDYVQAIGATKATVSTDVAAAFLEVIASLARL